MKRKLLHDSTRIPEIYCICERNCMHLLNPPLVYDFVIARPVYDCKAGLYLRWIHIAFKSRLMLAPPICDLRVQSKHAIPFLMNSHGITNESISMERIRYNRNIERIFIFRPRFNFPLEIMLCELWRFISRILRLSWKIQKYVTLSKTRYIVKNLILESLR